MLEDWLRHILFATMRWLHIVCTTLIVGGTLFFEFVLPIAVEDLKREQQLALLGKARWVFKRVVWVCAPLLLLSGAVTIYRMAHSYAAEQYRPSLHWAVAHVALSILALGIALLLTGLRRPPEHTIGWMRLNLVILLVAILSANITRHVRMTGREREDAANRSRMLQQMPAGVPHPTTNPATYRTMAPATLPAAARGSRDD